MTSSAPDGPVQDRDQKGELSAKERALAEAVAEFLDRSAKHGGLDIDAFCREYPDLQTELRPTLDQLQEMDTVLDGKEEGANTSPSKEDRIALPERLSGHKILGEIGAGGMGRVLIAYDEGLRRNVAIKTLSAKFSENAALQTRFMQEARALAQLRHPNIVAIYSLGKAEEPAHFVMELVEGTTLLQASRTLTVAQKAELMRKVALAVEYLHEHHIVHRDLKPANILVGADLEPKLLDFGLARHVDDADRITHAGDLMGTPDYFSPEQTRSGSLDARSDVFSLGTILYELLTGKLPFRAESHAERMRKIRETDPELPRRLEPELPGDLQNICLKAMEKNPADRFATAKEMAGDLERFLAGEKVLASPTTYTHLISGKIEQHLRELDGWRKDEILSDFEWDALRKSYGRLVEREDAWILEARRLSVGQVSLYLGAWLLIVGAALLFLFRFVHLNGAAPIALTGVACALTAERGMRLWQRGQLRVAIAYLLAFSLLLPIVLLVIMGEFHLWDTPAPDKGWELLWGLDEPFRKTTNAQLWWSLFLSLPAYIWLRRFTKSSVFSLVLAVISTLLCHATFLRFGLLGHFPDDPGWYYFRLIPMAMLFFSAAFALESRGFSNDSRYFYPIAVLATLGAFSGLAGFHKPYQDWLQRTFSWTRGQVEYLFIANAGAYLLLQHIFGRVPTPQMRTVAKSFRFLVPGHVLTSVLFLGLAATEQWNDAIGNLAMKREARLYEILLPVLACAFVFGGIPKQMKNYFVSGMVFLAIGVIRLQQNLFQDRALWPVSLMILGTLLMLFATRYASIKVFIFNMIRRPGQPREIPR